VIVVVVVGIFVGVAVVLGSVGVVLVLLEDFGWHFGGWVCDPRRVLGSSRLLESVFMRGRE
jgi:hypothetical protein